MFRSAWRPLLAESQFRIHIGRAQFKNNYFAEVWNGSEEGSYLRPIDFRYHSTAGSRVKAKRRKKITNFWAQGRHSGEGDNLCEMEHVSISMAPCADLRAPLPSEHAKIVITIYNTYRTCPVETSKIQRNIQHIQHNIQHNTGIRERAITCARWSTFRSAWRHLRIRRSQERLCRSTTRPSTAMRCIPGSMVYGSGFRFRRKVDVRLPGKGNSNYGARLVHLIITMI